MFLWQLISNIAVAASLNYISALSFALIYLPTRTFNFAFAAYITVGGYLAYIVSSHFGYPVLLAVPCAMLGSALVAGLIEDWVFRPLRSLTDSTWTGLVASIGIYMMITNAASLLFGDDVHTFSLTNSPHHFRGIYLTSAQIVTLGIAVVAYASVALFLHRTDFGLKIVAVSFSPTLSRIHGINSRRIIFCSVAIAAALSALLALVVSWDTGLSPDIGFHLLILGAVSMIISGVGSLRSFISGAILLAIAQTAAAFYFDSKWSDAIAFLVLVTFLTCKPLGFSGRRLKKAQL